MFLAEHFQCMKIFLTDFYYKFNNSFFIDSYVQQVPQEAPEQLPHPQQQSPIQAPDPQPLSEEDINNLMEMFPNVDKDVIKSIGEANRGDKNATINSLLQLTN